MGGLALRYGISVADLMTANPQVDPHAMSVGTELVIPAPINDETGPTQTMPAPAQMALGQVNCIRNNAAGVWCFGTVTNPQDSPVESVSAFFRLASDSEIQTEVALPLLDVLPPGATLALAAYFPQPHTGPLQAGVELRSALPLAAGADRYLPMRIARQELIFSEDGLSVQAEGEVTLDVSEGQAALIWVVATAYDTAGQVIGLRRWESNAPLAAGEAHRFKLAVYSAGPPIARVELQAEAKP